MSITEFKFISWSVVVVHALCLGFVRISRLFSWCERFVFLTDNNVKDIFFSSDVLQTSGCVVRLVGVSHHHRHSWRGSTADHTMLKNPVPVICRQQKIMWSVSSRNSIAVEAATKQSELHSWSDCRYFIVDRYKNDKCVFLKNSRIF